MVTTKVSKTNPPITAATTTKKTTGLALKVSHSALLRKLKSTKNRSTLMSQPPRTTPRKPPRLSFEPNKRLKTVSAVKANAAAPPARAASRPELPATRKPTNEPIAVTPRTNSEPSFRTLVITDFRSSNIDWLLSRSESNDCRPQRIKK